jgi:hypothetical protein
MSDFNYTEYLKNNPLLKKEVKDSLITESKEVTEESVEEVQEKSSKMKVSELKAKIKEDIMSLLQEEVNEESDLEAQLMADLDEEITEAKEDEEEDVEVDVEADVEADVEDEVGDEIGGGDADALDPEAGLTQDEQDIQNALKVAYDNAVALGDEKLSKQIGNTITMFTRTRVVNND